MTYLYECKQDECDEVNKTVEIDKTMDESGTPEICKECCHEMQRVYTTFAMKSADGFKS